MYTHLIENIHPYIVNQKYTHEDVKQNLKPSIIQTASGHNTNNDEQSEYF